MKTPVASRKGLTLLEIAVVISIIGAVAAYALPAFMGAMVSTRSSQCMSNRRAIETGLVMFQKNNPDAPLPTIAELAEGGYITRELRCPTGGMYLWLDPAVDSGTCRRIGCTDHYWASPPEEEEDAPVPLFASDFADMEGLSPLIGKWVIKNGALVPQGKGERRLAFGDAEWTDYEVHTTATLEKGKGYGVYYRADGEKNITGYILQYDPGYGGGEFIVRKVIAGREKSPFQRAKMPWGFPVHGTSHDITISVKGDRHLVQVDGDTVLDFTDSTWSSGSAGLRTGSKSEVRFDSVSVSEIE